MFIVGRATREGSKGEREERERWVHVVLKNVWADPVHMSWAARTFTVSRGDSQSSQEARDGARDSQQK